VDAPKRERRVVVRQGRDLWGEGAGQRNKLTPLLDGGDQNYRTTASGGGGEIPVGGCLTGEWGKIRSLRVRSLAFGLQSREESRKGEVET